MIVAFTGGCYPGRVSAADAGAPPPDVAEIPLDELPVGRWGRVCPPLAGRAPDRRLLVLGFVPGTRVGMIRRAPFGGPVEVELRGYRICLRRAQLAGLRVAPDDGRTA